MVAYGITSDGAPRLLAVEAVSAECHDAVVAFLRGLVARGLRASLLTVTDGAPGLIGAVAPVFPDSADPGDAAIAQARRRAGAFDAKWQTRYAV